MKPLAPSATLLFLLLCLHSLILTAQTNEGKSPLRISDVSFGFGGYSYTDIGLSLYDFKKLAPESELLKTDFTDFNSQGSYNNNYYEDDLESQSSVAEVTVGLSKEIMDYKKNHLYKEFRFGFTYQAGISSSRNYSHQDRTRFDTLISTQTGEEFYVDSVKSSSYNMLYSTEQVRLAASILFRLNPMSRWSLFAGAGLNFGMTINPHTEISYSYSEYISAPVQYPIYHESKNTWKNETFRNKVGMACSGYLIAGIDWRTGNKRAFWKRLHFSYDVRPVIDFNDIPENNSYTNTAILQQFTFRYSFNSFNK